MILTAPAKLNLCLYVGAPRDDGLHEIRSLFEPLSLADEIEVAEAAADEVVCAAVGGENSAARALAALRERGWEAPAMRVKISKRIPIAAGLGGGSADAAAVLRLAAEEVSDVEAVAVEIGADVLSQLDPGFALVSGAGERVEPMPVPAEHAIVLVPEEEGLSTARVYAEADRLGLGRGGAALDAISERLRDAVSAGASPLEYGELLINDLEPAALALRPGVAGTLERLREAGAERALLTGSGPTSFGLFADLQSAERAAAELGPPAITCEPVAR